MRFTRACALPGNLAGYDQQNFELLRDIKLICILLSTQPPQSTLFRNIGMYLFSTSSFNVESLQCFPKYATLFVLFPHTFIRRFIRCRPTNTLAVLTSTLLTAARAHRRWDSQEPARSRETWLDATRKTSSYHKMSYSFAYCTLE